MTCVACFAAVHAVLCQIRALIEVQCSRSMQQVAAAIHCVQIQGSYLFKQPSHRDFLGTIMSLGIARDAVGDILVHGEKPAQALVVPEIVELLEAELVQVRSCNLTQLFPSFA